MTALASISDCYSAFHLELRFQAKEKAERNRKELKGYMESLRSKLFQADGEV